jgi:hypothetical protein
LTVDDIEAEWLSAPLVPTTENEEDPVAAVVLADRVSVEDPLPLTDVGLNAQLRPEDRPEHEKPTAPLNPLSADTVQVLVVLEPWVTVSDDGLQARVKSGFVGAVGVALTQLLARPVHAEEAPAATTL